MEVSDRDLLSIQEARILVRQAQAAQAIFQECDQKRVDAVVKAAAAAFEGEAQSLAKMARDETGFGKEEDKVLKNLFASKRVYEHIKDLKTVGIINQDTERGLIEVGVPMGLITALIPSTNPTSTVIFKTLIALKAGCAVIFSPHPGARNCILATVEIARKTLKGLNLPPDLISSLSMPTKEATDCLMRHPKMNLILATGGNAMVKAAYSSGIPAIGVGPGNGPAFIEKTAEIPLAVKRILDSKTFDNGTICASEQSVITETSIRNKVMDELGRQGAYFLPPGDSERVERILMGPGRTMNAKLVGQTALFIAQAAGVSVPSSTKVLIGQETRVGLEFAYSREKLMPVLGFYVEDNWEKCCQKCIEILSLEGAGHTMTIHSKDENVIRQFGLKKPVSRLIVNAPAALAAIGAVTSLSPSLTLGCGAIGHNSTSDNVGPLNLINIRRVAYGKKELDDLRKEAPVAKSLNSPPLSINSPSPDLIEALVEKVMARLKI
ncbi:MAG: acetaldehyde dehydrogenase (acetylating) [Deltaproteobacteria bacterium]|nr:acetaldehyde dehydrogenase (acetylating) [Deltaproteobacteria bacterium]